MKAPDKIFMPNELLSEEWQRHVEGEDTAYVRKDALLEWAKEQKKDCERVIREHPEDDSLWCERDKYDELIDKIESI